MDRKEAKCIKAFMFFFYDFFFYVVILCLVFWKNRGSANN